MASFNRIILMGNLTRDPELSYTPSNTAVCKFGLATNHKWKDKEGATREQVCFVDCTLFGRSAETFKQYMAKGRSVLVEGRLEYQQWTAQDGGKRSKHAVIVDNFQFVGARGGGGQEGAGQDGGGQYGAGQDGADAGQRQGAPAGGPPEAYTPPGGEDNIPF